MNGGGGYTGGGGEELCRATENGQGGVGSTSCGGGGYFSSGFTNDAYPTYAVIGGQGGWSRPGTAFPIDSGGDGGIAGEGGTITVSVSTGARVYAYNGNKWTDEIHNADGTITYETGHEPPITNSTNQLEIYAQNGILRQVYKYNGHWGEKKYNNYSYLHTRLGSDLKITSTFSKATSSNPTSNFVIRDRIQEKVDVPETNSAYRKIKSGYVNPLTGSIYGIGSGAGYIEISNGTYIVN